MAEVDGFYRFPSLESCEVERCQRDYSALTVGWGESELCPVERFRLQYNGRLTAAGKARRANRHTSIFCLKGVP